MLKTDYDYTKATEATIEAMADRCHEQGHDYQNCASMMFQIYQRCKWCGQIR